MVRVCWHNGPLYSLVEVNTAQQGFWICNALPHVVKNYDDVSRVFDIDTIKRTPNFERLDKDGLLREYENLTPEEFLSLIKHSKEKPSGVDYWY